MSDAEHQEEVQPESEASPTPTRRTSSKKRAPVFTYLAILFVAAFFLLALSYFMQQRTMAESLNGLKDSVSAMGRAETLQTENIALREQLDALTQEKEALTVERDSLSDALTQAKTAAETQAQAAQAMDWFWQIDEAYVRGRYQLARNLMEKMDDALVAALPKESVTDTGRFSPADRYAELYNALY